MRFIAGLWRLAVAALCFIGTYAAWARPTLWVYLTVQIGFMLGLVMLWAGAASLLKGIQPPAWLKGCVTLYALIVALVSLLAAPDGTLGEQQALGAMAGTMLLRVAPVMAVADFILCDAHRRFRWHYCLSWLAYLPVWLVAVAVRAAIWPASGPGVGGNPYPYPFLDLGALGFGQFAVNVLQALAGAAGAALVLFIIDRIEPQRPLLG